MERKHLLIACSIGVALILVSFTRWRNKKEKRRRLRKKTQGSVNIGGIFGMDVGGTLTKIVYIEAKLSNHNHVPKPNTDRQGTEEIPRSSMLMNSPMMRSNSFGNLIEPEHQAALHQLYTNMTEFDKQASTYSYVRDSGLSFYSSILEGRIHFLHFETRNMMNAIKLLESSGVTEHIQTIGCSGGGAHKYATMFEDELNITFKQYDELGSLIKGMNFALTNVKDECYTYRDASDEFETATPSSSSSSTTEATNDKPEKSLSPDRSHLVNHAKIASSPTSAVSKGQDGSMKGPTSSSSSWKQRNAKQYNSLVNISHEIFTQSSLFPYLVVNIGSGVSILKVNSSTSYERVSGSSLGGGTYWGLCRLLTHCESYEEVLDLAESGDSTNIDMLVKDIYGGGYDGINLSAAMVASSFGKLVMKENPREGIKEEDLALALLMMITNNIGQVAFLNARLHGCSKIFFVGSFLRHNAISCKRLAYSIDFWSKGAMEALFLRHEGYFGALGTFLQEAFGDNLDKILASCVETDSATVQESTQSALAFVNRGRRSSKNQPDQEESPPASTVYGLDSQLLQKIRAWQPLSFSALMKSKSKKDKRDTVKNKSVSHDSAPGTSVISTLKDASLINSDMITALPPTSTSVLPTESRKRSGSFSAAQSLMASPNTGKFAERGKRATEEKAPTAKLLFDTKASRNNEASEPIYKVEDYLPLPTVKLDSVATPSSLLGEEQVVEIGSSADSSLEYEIASEIAHAEHQKWIVQAEQYLAGDRDRTTTVQSSPGTFGRSSRTMSENAASVLSKSKRHVDSSETCRLHSQHQGDEVDNGDGEGDGDGEASLEDDGCQLQSPTTNIADTNANSMLSSSTNRVTFDDMPDANLADASPNVDSSGSSGFTRRRMGSI